MNYSLKPWNTFGILHYANRIVSVKNIQQLLKEREVCVKNNQPMLILGEGSNTLFLENFLGTIVVNRIKGIIINESKNYWNLHVGAGENWHKLVQFTIKNNMPGLENLAFIHGCVGSSPIQNIGAYGVELSKFCNYVDCIELKTGKFQRLNAKDCKFGYRNSVFKNKYQKKMAIIAVGICLSKVWKPTLNHENLSHFDHSVTPKQIFDTISYIRSTKLPNIKTYGNAGSFFKNPVFDKNYYKKILLKWPNAPFHFQLDGSIKLPANWLIKNCQLEYTTFGGASIYYRNPIVIINKNNATSKNIIQLAKYIRKCVIQKFDIWLEPEVHFIGKVGEVNAMEILF